MESNGLGKREEISISKDDEKITLAVMKFGGSSIRDADCIRNVANIVLDNLFLHPIVVLSAIGKTTDEILVLAKRALDGQDCNTKDIFEYHRHIAQKLNISREIVEDIESLLQEADAVLLGVKLVRELTSRTCSLLMSYGERMSVRLFAAYLSLIGKKSKAFDSWSIGMITTQGYSSAESSKTDVELLESSYKEIRYAFSHLKREYCYIPIVTGFIAKDQEGNVTTLGRSGSDLSATIIGAAVGASEIQIWTDVSGILTADPQVVENAQNIDFITFEQASELATFGANVIHPRALQPAISHGISVCVKNSFDPTHPGTKTVCLLPQNKRIVTAITSQSGITVMEITSRRMVGVHGYLSKIFKAYDDEKISVNVVATSEVSVSLTLDQYVDEVKLRRLIKILEDFSFVTIHKKKGLVSVIGNPSATNEIIQKTCLSLDSIGVRIQLISYGASKLNFTFLIECEEIVRTVKALHAMFFRRSVVQS